MVQIKFLIYIYGEVSEAKIMKKNLPNLLPGTLLYIANHFRYRKNHILISICIEQINLKLLLLKY